MNVEMPGEWTGWPELPEGLECDQCDQSFGVGDDVWVIDADHPPGAVAHICLDCAEKFLYRLQREHPEMLPGVAQKINLVLYRPERELSLDEITVLEVATKMLQGENRQVVGHHLTVH